MAKSGSGGGRGAGGGGGAASSAAIADAEKTLADAEAQTALLNKAYNKRNQLTVKEEDQVRKLLNGKPIWPVLKKAREAEFDAREKLKALRGDKSDTATLKTQTGIMSNKEAGTKLNAAELALARSSLYSQNRNLSEGRRQLASDRESDSQRFNKLKRDGTIPKNMTLEEYSAVRRYTANGYIGMNAAMRGLQTDGTSNLAQRQRVTARLANQGLQKLAGHQGTAYQGEVQRFTRMPKAEVEQYAPGRTISFNGITSTTFGGSSAAGSYGGSGGDSLTKASSYGTRAQAAGVKTSGGTLQQVEYRINVKNGANISGVSGRSFEREVALSHGFQGRVSQVERSGNKTIVYMDEI